LKNRQHEIAQFIEKETPLAGIAKTKALGVLELAYRADNPGDYQDFPLDLNFSEEEKKKPAHELVKEFMRTLPKLVEFSQYEKGNDHDDKTVDAIDDAVVKAQGGK
jgi:hypothetical protein